MKLRIDFEPGPFSVFWDVVVLWNIDVKILDGAERGVCIPAGQDFDD